MVRRGVNVRDTTDMAGAYYVYLGGVMKVGSMSS